MKLKPEEISSVIKEQIERYASQMEVADEICISQAQVSRLEKNALKAMRSYLKP